VAAQIRACVRLPGLRMSWRGSSEVLAKVDTSARL